jgi:hypothetical protein
MQYTLSPNFSVYNTRTQSCDTALLNSACVVKKAQKVRVGTMAEQAAAGFSITCSHLATVHAKFRVICRVGDKTDQHQTLLQLRDDCLNRFLHGIHSGGVMTRSSWNDRISISLAELSHRGHGRRRRPSPSSALSAGAIASSQSTNDQRYCRRHRHRHRVTPNHRSY